MKVFISSTYLDLKDYRQVVITVQKTMWVCATFSIKKQVRLVLKEA